MCASQHSACELHKSFTYPVKLFEGSPPTKQGKVGGAGSIACCKAAKQRTISDGPPLFYVRRLSRSLCAERYKSSKAVKQVRSRAGKAAKLQYGDSANLA